MVYVMSMNKTLLIVIGGPDRQLVVDQLKTEYCIWDIDFETKRLEAVILKYLINFDDDQTYDDVVFITTSTEVSSWFISNKYNEKVAYYGGVDRSSYRGPAIQWTDMTELPSIIKRLEGNVSEDANF
jgi:hypothetical protein